jgi:hypothetical protein
LRLRSFPARYRQLEVDVGVGREVNNAAIAQLRLGKFHTLIPLAVRDCKYRVRRFMNHIRILVPSKEQFAR